MLREAGFALIIHDEHFGRRQDVLDPEVIRACGENGWFLMTADSDLPRRWAKEMSIAQIGVFCQTNNHQGPKLWAPRICSLKAEIMLLASTEARPFTAYITAEIKPQLLLRKA
ncbi:hypothetical protein HNQ77_003563 [Silvibacterium bohemicum]|uniref:VapC45 PIN like domain-containing protein n=2 Tax=Silvibacterium bohemicum TaxID=1577686 RepID=A0A841JW43_9BACT|nr:hypothetical protein [Silvibacterium bohemicum]